MPILSEEKAQSSRGFTSSTYVDIRTTHEDDRMQVRGR